jgi:HEAT repeat protein
MDFVAFFERIGEPGAPVVSRDVRPLSDIAPSERSAFLSSWQRVIPERRAEIVRYLIDLSEDNVDLQFQRVLLWCTEDHDPQVRTLAIEGLWESDQTEVMRRLIELLQADTHTDVREAAASGLGRFAYLAELGELDDLAAERVLKQLLTTIRDTNQPGVVRRRALESAGYFANEDALIEQIEQAYAAEDQERKESALVAMGRTMLPRWLLVIGNELESRSPALRYEAARAAGEYGDDARPLLSRVARLLGDSDTEVAIAAIWALGQIGGAAAKRVLTEATKSEHEARAQAATDALAELALDQGIVGDVRGYHPRTAHNN